MTWDEEIDSALKAETQPERKLLVAQRYLRDAIQGKIDTQCMKCGYERWDDDLPIESKLLSFRYGAPVAYVVDYIQAEINVLELERQYSQKPDALRAKRIRWNGPAQELEKLFDALSEDGIIETDDRDAFMSIYEPAGTILPSQSTIKPYKWCGKIKLLSYLLGRLTEYGRIPTEREETDGGQEIRVAWKLLSKSFIDEDDDPVKSGSLDGSWQRIQKSKPSDEVKRIDKILRDCLSATGKR